MSRFEISTCFMGTTSDVDPQVVSDTLAKIIGNEIFDSAWFVLQTDNCFNLGRLSHTNVRVLVTADLERAKECQVALSEATGRRWNAPTQDPDDRDKELGDAPGWGMFTTAGSLAVGAMVERIDGKLRNGELSPIHLAKALDTEREVLVNAGHGEVYDTAVREELGQHFDRTLEELGVQLVGGYL